MDINAILSAAVAAIVEQVTAPLVARMAALEASQFKAERVADTEPDRISNDLVSGLDFAELRQRVDDLETVLGAVYVIDELGSVADGVKAGASDALVLAGQMRYRIEKLVEDGTEQALDQHNRSYDHDEFYSSSDGVFDAIEDRLEDFVNEKIEEATSDDLADKVRKVLRQDITFTVEVD